MTKLENLIPGSQVEGLTSDGSSVTIEKVDFYGSDAAQPSVDPESGPTPGSGGGPDDPPPPVEKQLSSYYGSVNLNPTRPNKHMSDIVQEITQHMSTQPGARASISVRVEIKLPNGLDEGTQRTVLENSKALKFDDFGFRVE